MKYRSWLFYVTGILFLLLAVNRYCAATYLGDILLGHEIIDIVSFIVCAIGSFIKKKIVCGIGMILHIIALIIEILLLNGIYHEVVAVAAWIEVVAWILIAIVFVFKIKKSVIMGVIAGTLMICSYLIAMQEADYEPNLLFYLVAALISIIVGLEVTDSNLVLSKKKSSTLENYDELLKLQELLDKGIINQDEFDKKKQDLL